MKKDNSARQRSGCLSLNPSPDLSSTIDVLAMVLGPSPCDDRPGALCTKGTVCPEEGVGRVPRAVWAGGVTLMS